MSELKVFNPIQPRRSQNPYSEFKCPSVQMVLTSATNKTYKAK